MVDEKRVMWFRHDADAHLDLDIIQLIEDLGYEAFGLWMALLGTFCGKPRHGYKLRLSKDTDTTCQRLALALRVKPDTLRAVVNECLDLGLLQVDDDWLWSDSLIRRMGDREKAADELRQSAGEWGRLGARKRWGKNGGSNGPNSHPIRPNGGSNGPNGVDDIGSLGSLGSETARAPDSNIRDSNSFPSGQSPDPNPYTGHPDPAPIAPATGQPMPWDPYDSQSGRYPVPHIPDYWHRRAVRAINELAAKHQPLSHLQRDALMAEAAARDEMSAQNDRGRESAAPEAEPADDPLFDASKPKPSPRCKPQAA